MIETATAHAISAGILFCVIIFVGLLGYEIGKAHKPKPQKAKAIVSRERDEHGRFKRKV